VRFLALFIAVTAFASSAKFDAQLRDGLLALSRGDAAVAEKHLRAAIELDSQNGTAWLALAQAQARQQKVAASLASAEKAYQSGATDPRVLHGLTLFYVEARKFDMAADTEVRYAQLAKDDKDASRRAAQLYLAAHLPKKAIELGLIALKTQDTPQVRNLLGKAYEADGQTGKAVLELQTAIQKNEYEESYYFDLAYVLLQHQNFDTAIQLLVASRRVFATSAQLQLALGVAYYGQRRFEDAVQSFLRTIAIDPAIGQPYLFLGRILEHAEKRLPEIVARFSARAEAMPEDFMAQCLLGKALALQGDERAEKILRASIALKEDYWESHYELGLILDKARKFEEAARELERSAALNAALPAPHYRLARVYDRLGRREDAAKERNLHQRLTAEEKAAMEKHASGIKRLELVIR